MWHFIDIVESMVLAVTEEQNWETENDQGCVKSSMLYISSVKHFCVCNLSLMDMKILKYKGLLRTENERKVWESKTTKTFDTLTTGLLVVNSC